MQIKKSGFPQEEEIVLCIVKKIQRTTVFVKLEEYENKEGIIHISEISPGRIRTIRDFVKEGKRVVCKVLRKNERYGNLDLSLRRVTTGQKLNKLKEVKLEDKCKKIIESVSKQMKLDFTKVYTDLNKKISKEYDSIGAAFQDIAEESEISLESLGVEKKISSALEETIKARLKPQEIKNTKDLMITCPAGDGIVSIKKSIKKALDLAKKKEYNAKISYVSAPKYCLSIVSSEPKQLESQTEEIINELRKEIEKANGTLEIQKAKK